MEVKVKWSGKLLIFELPETATLQNLKDSIYEKTQIRPERQKIIGVKFLETDLIKEIGYIFNCYL